MTKFTRLKDFPMLESALFVLMSYSSFLIAEVADLTGMYKRVRCTELIYFFCTPFCEEQFLNINIILLTIFFFSFP